MSLCKDAVLEKVQAKFFGNFLIQDEQYYSELVSLANSEKRLAPAPVQDFSARVLSCVDRESLLRDCEERMRCSSPETASKGELKRDLRQILAVHLIAATERAGYATRLRSENAVDLTAVQDRIVADSFEVTVDTLVQAQTIVWGEVFAVVAVSALVVVIAVGDAPVHSKAPFEAWELRAVTEQIFHHLEAQRAVVAA